MTLRIALLLGILFTACGCGGAANPSPGSTLTAVQQAATRKDADALYALLPDQARRAETIAAFRARMAANPVELDALAQAIQRAGIEHHVALAAVPVRGGGETLAVDDADGWRVAAAGFGPAVTLTPADTLRAMRSALLRQSLPEVLALLSSTTRGSVQAEISSLIDALEDPSGLTRATTGPATMPTTVDYTLPDGRHIRLRREGDVYRVDGVE